MDRVLRMMDAQLTEGGVLRHGMGLHGRHTGALNTDYRIAGAEQIHVITSEQSNTSVILRPADRGKDESALREDAVIVLSLIHISEPTRQCCTSRMPSSA